MSSLLLLLPRFGMIGLRRKINILLHGNSCASTLFGEILQLVFRAELKMMLLGWAFRPISWRVSIGHLLFPSFNVNG
ncbi:MAG TPA: hypothetical protein DEX36_09990 [Glutamicibacter sp.]|nr:hypothetical protein [Glutamicibacter sp.]